MNNGENPKRNNSRIIAICAIIFVTVFAIVNIRGVTDTLSSIFSVLTPIVVGFAIAYLLNPMLRFYEFKVFKKLKNKNVIRGLSIACTFITAALIIASFLWLLIPQIIKSVKDLITNYDDYVHSTAELLNSIINKFLPAEPNTKYLSAEKIQKWVTDFFASSSEIMNSILDYLSEFGIGLFVGVKNTILGIFIAVYILIAKEKLQALARKLGAAFIPENKLIKIKEYVHLTHKTFSGYLVGTIIDAVIVLVVTLIALLIFDIHYPLLIAVIVGATNIIPFFGPFIGGIPSFLILLLVDPQEALIFLVLIVVIQQIEGNIIAPKILGESTGISSLAVLIAIIIMGDYFGVVGMIIGVPIFAVASVIITEMTEAKLTKRGKATELDAYYTKDDMIDPSIKHQPLVSRIFYKIARIILKIGRALRGGKPPKRHKKHKKSSNE